MSHIWPKSISHILEPITFEAPGCEIDSTSDMLSKIDKLNDELANGKANYQVPPNNDIATNLDLKENMVIEPQSESESKFKKFDIRSYGKRGVKTIVKSGNVEILSHVISLRKSCN